VNICITLRDKNKFWTLVRIKLNALPKSVPTTFWVL